MSYCKLLRKVAGSLFLVAGLVWPAQVAVQAAGSASGAGATGTYRNLEATVAGVTTDQKYKVQLDVSRATGGTVVELNIAVTANVPSATAGSTYVFTVPGSDLTVDTQGVTLNTHKHLGAYGSITAQWRFTTKPVTVRDTDPCATTPNATAVTHTTATGTATLNLSFPCEGVVKAVLHAGGVDIKSGELPAPAADNPGLTQSVYQGIYFSGAVAMKPAQGKQLLVGSYRFDNGPTLLFAGIDSPTNTAIGLSQSDYYATAALSAGALSVGTSATTLHYSGTLGTADLVFTAKPPSVTAERPAQCVAPNAGAQDKSKMLALSLAQASVSGSVSLTACATVRTTFGAADKGFLLATSATTGGGPIAPNPSPQPTAPSLGGGAGISTGTLRITKVTPADGATGVPTSASISVTFSAAPNSGQINFVLTGADNPTIIAAVPLPTYDPTTNTASATPMMPLLPNTRYRLVVLAVGVSGMATTTTTFTTGT